jgi:hypothetical protein
MSYTVRIYRTVARQGSVISTELLTELAGHEFPDDTQELAEAYGGDFATVELENETLFDSLCV